MEVPGIWNGIQLFSEFTCFFWSVCINVTFSVHATIVSLVPNCVSISVLRFCSGRYF